MSWNDAIDETLRVVDEYRRRCCHNSDAAMQGGHRDEAGKWVEHALAAVALTHQIRHLRTRDKPGT
jgi:hypothetical protein